MVGHRGDAHDDRVRRPTDHLRLVRPRGVDRRGGGELRQAPVRIREALDWIAHDLTTICRLPLRPARSEVTTALSSAAIRARKLHKRLHTHCTFDAEQVHLNAKAPFSGVFAEPLTDSNLRPPPYHRATRRNGGQGREAAGTEVPQEEGIARRRVTSRGLRCPRWCSLSVPSRVRRLRARGSRDSRCRSDGRRQCCLPSNMGAAASRRVRRWESPLSPCGMWRRWLRQSTSRARRRLGRTRSRTGCRRSFRRGRPGT